MKNIPGEGEERRSAEPGAVDGSAVDAALQQLHARSVGEERLASAFESAVTIPATPRLTVHSPAGGERDGREVVVAVVFGRAGSPPREVVYRMVCTVLKALVPPFYHAGHDIGQYEIQYAHTDATGERVVYRRVRLGAERAERYLADGSLDPMGLARIVAHEHDGEEESAIDCRRFDPRRPADGDGEERAPIYEASQAAQEGAVADCIRGRTGEERV